MANRKEYQKKYYQDHKEAGPQSRILPVSLKDLPGHCMAIAMRIHLGLLVAPWGTHGFPYHMDTPLGNPPLNNWTRPAVVRAHFGLNVLDGVSDGECSEYVWRYVYGTGSGTGSVCTDPRFLQTKVMTNDMVVLGDILRIYVQNHQSDLFPGIKGMNFKQPFNSVAILLYLGGNIIDEITETTLGYHTHVEYGKDGEFKACNSQKENTAVVVITFGDPRTVYLLKRKLFENGCWSTTGSKKYKKVLKTGSIFVFHPDDEILKQRSGSKTNRSQFLHGGVKVRQGLSIAMIYRTVTSKALIHVSDNTQKLGPKEMLYLDTPKTMGTGVEKPRKEYLTERFEEELQQKARREKQFKDYINHRMEEDTLFTGTE
jgi:hypothetical protein